jgi:hypothetical protein
MISVGCKSEQNDESLIVIELFFETKRSQKSIAAYESALVFTQALKTSQFSAAEVTF